MCPSKGCALTEVPFIEFVDFNEFIGLVQYGSCAFAAWCGLLNLSGAVVVNSWELRRTGSPRAGDTELQGMLETL